MSKVIYSTKQSPQGIQIAVWFYSLHHDIYSALQMLVSRWKELIEQWKVNNQDKISKIGLDIRKILIRECMKLFKKAVKTIEYRRKKEDKL